MAATVKKKGKETNVAVAAWFLILGIAAIAGAAYLTDGRILKTQVAPGEELFVGEDWESIKVPGLSVEQADATEICPSPTPSGSPSYSPSPSGSPDAYSELNNIGAGRVAGLWLPHVGIAPRSCSANFITERFRKYSLNISKENIIRTELGGLSPRDTLTAICHGDPSPPRCSAGAVGCAWMVFNESPRPAITFTMLYLKLANGLFMSAGKDYIYPAYVPNQEELPEAVFPSPAKGEENIPVYLGMSLWGLSPGAVHNLDEHHPKLLEAARKVISETEGHEKKHWEIFREYLPKYEAVINDTQYSANRSASSPGDLAELIKDELVSAWSRVAEEEDARHDLFHSGEEVRVRHMLLNASIPYDGLGDIYCAGMNEEKAMVGTFSLEISGQGYVSADYDGARGREIVINSDVDILETVKEKTYFTDTDISVEAQPAWGYRFVKWQSREPGRPCGCNGSTAPVCTLQIGGAGGGCRAIFELEPE